VSPGLDGGHQVVLIKTPLKTPHGRDISAFTRVFDALPGHDVSFDQ
jgi:hypothetical protein